MESFWGICQNIGADDEPVLHLRHRHRPIRGTLRSAVSELAIGHHYLNDANFNVMALLDTAGDAVERYLYSPYGVATIYDATWTNTRSTSSYGNVTLYTGRELDAETGLYYYRNRNYSAERGRFVSRDPIGQTGGVNVYAYVANSPTNRNDATGL